MHFLTVLFVLAQAMALPLQKTSFLTLRTTAPPPSGGGNTQPAIYRELILEEWSQNPTQLLQSWPVPCTLPSLSTETWTEGRLSPRYPWGDEVWFLCRNVPANSSLSYNPAPVSYMYLSEEGSLASWVEEPLYPNGTNLINIIPYWDESQSLNVFYLLGGGTQANGPSSPAKPAQARIRVDAGPGIPPDAQGALVATSQGVTINQLRILNKTLYGTGLFSGSTGLPNPMIYQIGSEGSLPVGTRNPTAQIPNFPLVLSVWTDPFSAVWWRTGINRTAYIARHDNSDGSDLVYALPASASAGTLGGASWSILTARQENSDFAIYLTNTSHIVKNTQNGFTNGFPYQTFLQAPPGWRYLSAHARNPNIPTPSATATATATSSASASASASATATATSSTSATSSSTSSPSATAQPTSTSTPSSTASASSTSYPTTTPTATRNPQISADPSPSHSPSATPSPSITPSTTPSNGTIPVPPDSNQAQSSSLTVGQQAGISIGTIGAICVAGLLLLNYSPAVKRLYISQFGSSSKHMKTGVSFRNPVASDVPITISHNPQVLVQQRLEQLRDLQKRVSMKEINQSNTKTSSDRTKKEFQPVITSADV